MTRSHTVALASALALALAVAPPARAQTPGAPLGVVPVARGVLANGQPLAAGTYTLRLAAETVTPVVGQTPEQSRWVEFVQGDQVKGREIATVLTAADLAAVSTERAPKPGQSRADLLVGGDYLRLWINHAGTHYLVHLPIARR